MHSCGALLRARDHMPNLQNDPIRHMAKCIGRNNRKSWEPWLQTAEVHSKEAASDAKVAIMTEPQQRRIVDCCGLLPLLLLLLLLLGLDGTGTGQDATGLDTTRWSVAGLDWAGTGRNWTD